MKKFFIFPFVFVFLTSLIKIVSAHCPLCTIGAGAAGGLAVWLGVSKVVVALFLGGFAMSMGMWFSRIPKKKYIPYQKTIIIAVVFLSTVIPLLPLFSAVGPIYLSFIGEYGTTLAFNYSIGGSILGGLVVFVSPTLNKKIKQKRGKGIPFQGVLITLGLLAIFGTAIQFWLV